MTFSPSTSDCAFGDTPEHHVIQVHLAIPETNNQAIPYEFKEEVVDGKQKQLYILQILNKVQVGDIFLNILAFIFFWGNIY